MLPIEELMGLLGSSCHEQHPICLGRKSKEMLMWQRNSQVLLKQLEGSEGPTLSCASVYSKDILNVFFIAFCLLIKDMFLFINVDGPRAGGKGSSLKLTAKG